MIVTGGRIDVAAFERRTGWRIAAGEAVRGDRRVPIASAEPAHVAARLGMPVVEDRGVLCLGPESGGPSIARAEMPDAVLCDPAGREVALRSLLGRRLLIVAWASW